MCHAKQSTQYHLDGKAHDSDDAPKPTVIQCSQAVRPHISCGGLLANLLPLLNLAQTQPHDTGSSSQLCREATFHVVYDGVYAEVGVNGLCCILNEIAHVELKLSLQEVLAMDLMGECSMQCI